MSEVTSALTDAIGSLSKAVRLIINNTCKYCKLNPYIATGSVVVVIVSISTYAFFSEDLYTKEEMIEIITNDMPRRCETSKFFFSDSEILHRHLQKEYNTKIPNKKKHQIAAISIECESIDSKFLKSIKNLNNLLVIYAYGSHLEDIDFLYDLNYLKLLILTKTNFPKEDRERLRKALPDTKILF